MNRTIFELRRADWTAWPKALAVVAVAGFAVYGASVMLGSDSPTSSPGAVGVDADATRQHLRELSAVLVTANKKSDEQLASQVKLQVIATMVTIDHQPGAKDLNSPMHACATAARNLVDAATVVENGGRWLNEDTFQEAAANCRS